MFVYLPNMMPNKLTAFYTKQINKAADLISAWWENAESFMKAKKLMFLERAYLNQFNRQWTTTDTYFTKIFDTTPELYFGDKLKNIATNGNTRATNATKINENAAVELWVMSVDNRIIVWSGSQVPVMKTVYDIYFQNMTTENQEVVINFEAPNDLSVVSDLKLWLDLQFQWQVASRGAARKVYEDSLRINKDPALIEKVGISTYNLRVFPILSKRDERTQWRQRVQITLHTPIAADEPISYAPKFSLINTRVDKNSSLVSKVFLNKKLIKEDIIWSEAMDAYLQTAHMLDETITAQIPEQSIFETCIPQMMHNGTLALDILPIFALTTGYQQPLETEKIYVFMDNSASVERNTDTKQRYPQIYSALKNYGDELQDVELYTFNFRVDPVASIDGVQFWWYSDVDSVISFIEKNTIRNSRIIIVTDDDSYNATTTEVKNRKFDTLLSNQLNVIKLGNEIKRYKSDFVSLLSATQWNIYHVDGTGSLDQALNSVFADSRKLIPVCSSGDVVPAPTQETIVMNKIYAGYLASRMMRSVWWVNDRNAIADKQNKLATAFGIVTQFNSMIALENERQQRDLEKYEQQNDRFDSNFNNYSNKQGEKERMWFGNNDNVFRDTRSKQQGEWTNNPTRWFDDGLRVVEDVVKTKFDSSKSMRFENNNNVYINPSATRSADLSVRWGWAPHGQQDRFVDVVKWLIYWILAVLALIAFLIVVYWGIKTATSTSNDDKDSAWSIIIKRWLYWIGLIVVAWFIINVWFWALAVTWNQWSYYWDYPQHNQVDINVFWSLLYLWVWGLVLYHRYLVLVVIGKDIFWSKKEQHDEEGDDWKNESLVQ